MIPGVGMETMFAKGLLDKVGVKADYVQIGQYKGADEQYTREFASDELKGELNKILDSLYEQIVEGIAYHRNISKNEVTDLINGVFVNGLVARDRKLVDHLLDEDGLRELIKKELGRDINLIHNYGEAEREQLDFFVAILRWLGALTRKPAESKKPAIALVYAEGVIVDWRGRGWASERRREYWAARIFARRCGWHRAMRMSRRSSFASTPPAAAPWPAK